VLKLEFKSSELFCSFSLEPGPLRAFASLSSFWKKDSECELPPSMPPNIRCSKPSADSKELEL
jgi:hypothetical protein